MDDINEEAKQLITKTANTFDDYFYENRYVGILEFMMICTESAKLIEKQRLRILELEIKGM